MSVIFVKRIIHEYPCNKGDNAIGSVTKPIALSPLLQGFLLSFSPHKPFELEGQEVGEGIELAVLHNTLSQNSKGKRLEKSQNSICFCCENHKIPDSFVALLSKKRKYSAKKKRQPSQATASNLQ